MNEAPRETIELDLHLTFQCRKLVTKNSASMEYTDLWDTSTTPSPILQIFFPKIKAKKKIPGVSTIHQICTHNLAGTISNVPANSLKFLAQPVDPVFTPSSSGHTVKLTVCFTKSASTWMTKSWEGLRLETIHHQIMQGWKVVGSFKLQIQGSTPPFPI